MANPPRPSETKISSDRGTEAPLHQPMSEGQQTCSGLNSVLFKLSPDDSNSIIAEANFDAQTKTLNIILKKWNAVLVGSSNAGQYEYNCHLGNKQSPQQKRSFDEDLQSDSGPKEKYNNEQRKKIIKEEEILADVEPSLPVIGKQGFLNGPQCEKMLKNLELLQDNGKFENHKHMFNYCLQRCVEKDNSHMEVIGEEQQNSNRGQCKQVLKKLKLFQENRKLKKDENLFSLFSRLCTKKVCADMELALVIEQGVSLMYHKGYSKSKLYFTSVIELGRYCQLRNPNILIARAYFLLADNYRCKKTKNVSAVFECLRRSEALLQNHETPEDWAEMYYILGSVWLAYMSMIPDDEKNAQARAETRHKAGNYYELAIAICKKDPRSRVQLKNLTYCHLGLAALLLDCTSTVARTQIKVIPQQDINNAIKHLDVAQYKLDENIPRGTFVQILKTRSDQYYRQGPGMYQLAKETAQEALRIAHCHGFNTELDSLQERIDFLDQLCEDVVCKERIRLLVDGDCSTSGSDSRFETSCSETDENQKTVDSLSVSMNTPANSDEVPKHDPPITLI